MSQAYNAKEDLQKLKTELQTFATTVESRVTQLKTLGAAPLLKVTTDKLRRRLAETVATVDRALEAAMADQNARIVFAVRELMEEPDTILLYQGQPVTQVSNFFQELEYRIVDPAHWMEQLPAGPYLFLRKDGTWKQYVWPHAPSSSGIVMDKNQRLWLFDILHNVMGRPGYPETTLVVNRYNNTRRVSLRDVKEKDFQLVPRPSSALLEALSDQPPAKRQRTKGEPSRAVWNE